MAQALVQNVKVGQIYHHPEYNVARLGGDSFTDTKKKALTASMVREGWRQNGDGVLEVTKITKEWAERAAADYTKRWEDLKAQVEKDSKQFGPRLHVFEHNHVKKGKILVPDYMGVSGNCRAQCIDDANVARFTAVPTEESPEPLSLIDTIPVMIREFANEKERAIAQMLENTGKLEGFSKPSEKDMLKCAAFILEQGGIQTDIRRAFGDTTGQKVFGILTLNKRFPGVKLLERIISRDPTDPTFIRYSSIKGADLPTLVLRSDSKALDEKNRKERTAGRGDLLPLDQAGLEDFLGTPKTNDPKIMKKENIQSLKDNNSNTIVKAVASSIMSNNIDPLNKFIVNAPVYNTVETLCDLGVGPDLEAILVGLTKAQDLGVAIKSVKAALKV